MREASRIYAFPRNLVLAASAGTGKTHSLVGVLVHLLLGASELGGAPRGPVDPGRIVATTFSRKAAAEIRARVVEELERLASCDERAKYRADLDAARDRAGLPRWTDAEVSTRARDALGGMGRAQIGTLHGFASSLLRRYALERGLSPTFELADEDVTRERVEEAIARAIERFEATDAGALADLVAAAGGAELLVGQLASALARLEEDGRGAASLAVHDTDTAALDSLLRDVLDHARALSRAPRFDVPAAALLRAWESGDVAALAAAAEDFCGVRAGGSDGPEAAEWIAFRDTVLVGPTNRDRGRNLIVRWRLRERFAAAARFARSLLAACEEEARAAADRASALTYGDLLRGARDLLRDRPDVAAEVGAQLDVLLVDEVQDTSRLQRDLLLLLWQKDPESRAAGTLPRIADVRAHGLFLVGDRKQSIYSFRGADVGVFAELCVGLAGVEARRALGIEAGRTWEPEVALADFVPLRHNRRGEPELLAFANELSAQRFRPGEPAELYEIAYVPHTEDLLPPPERRPPAEPARRTVWLRVVPQDKPNASTASEEASVIAARVRRMVDDGEPRVRGEPPRWRDVAVLAETNRMLDHVAYALACAGVPYVVAGSGFYNAREVRDLVAMLALLLDPSQAWAILEVLRGPWAGVRDETLIALTDPRRGLAPLGPAWDEGSRRAAIHPPDRVAIARVRAVVEPLHRDLDRLRPGPALREAVRALELEEVLVRLPRGPQRVANVRKLLASADRHRDARALLERLEDAAERERAEGEAATFSDEDDAVRLLTVHASKGLDFPIVLLPEVGKDQRRVDADAFRIAFGTGDDTPYVVARLIDAEGHAHEGPSYERARDEARRRARAERQRLAYVASTRASHAMLFVGERAQPQSGVTEAYAGTTAAALRAIADSPERRARARFAVEDVVPEPPAAPAPFGEGPEPAVEHAVTIDRPAWRSLAMASTALQDFASCGRRFQLVHLLDFPEPPWPGAPEVSSSSLVARRDEALARRIVARVDAASFGATLLARAEAARILGLAGVGPSDPRQPALVERALRFLGSAYAERVTASKASVARDVPFEIDLSDDEGRRVTLRGSIDVLVRWAGGAIDAIDVTHARSPDPTPHALRLDAYVLGARALHPDATRVRAGVVFLGAGGGEPQWRAEAETGARVEKRLAAYAAAIVDARWSERYPRAAPTTCEALRCGYVKHCYP